MQYYGSAVMNLPTMQEPEDTELDPWVGNSLEKEMATHSSMLLWEIP